MIGAFTFGGTIVPFINIVKTLICNNYMHDRQAKDPSFMHKPVLLGQEDDFCSTNTEVLAAIAMFTLYGQLAGGITSAFSSPKLGALSDRYGRRRLLAFTVFGSIIKDSLIILAVTRPKTFSIYTLLVAYALDGLCGSFTTMMAVSNAYASDCTPPARRAIAFGRLHGCLFTGIAFGPLFAGYIIAATGELVSVFYIALVAHAAFLLFLAFVLPESLTMKRQLAARENHRLAEERYVASLSDFSGFSYAKAVLQKNNIFAPLKILNPTGSGSSPSLRRNLVLLSAVDTIMFGAAMGSMTVVLIYTGSAFHWDNLDTSRFLSVVNISRVSCLLVLLPLITRLVRGKPSPNVKQSEDGCDSLDLGLIRGAVLFDTLGFIGYAVATTGGMMVAAGMIAGVGGIGSPTLQSSLTKHIPPENVGQLLGAIGLLHALARVVAPTVFNYIYAKTVVRDMPQTVFVVLAACFGLAFLASLFLRPKGECRSPSCG